MTALTELLTTCRGALSGTGCSSCRLGLFQSLAQIGAATPSASRSAPSAEGDTGLEPVAVQFVILTALLVELKLISTLPEGL